MMEDLIFTLERKLRVPELQEKKAVKYLKTLSKLPMTLAALKSTKVGKTVNHLAKHSTGMTQSLSKDLLEKWKTIVADGERSKVNTLTPKEAETEHKEAAPSQRMNADVEKSHSKRPTTMTSSSSFLNSMNEGLMNANKKRKRERETDKKSSRLETTSNKKQTPNLLKAPTTTGLPKPSLPDLQLPVLPNISLPDITPNYCPSYHYHDEEEETSRKKKVTLPGELTSKIASRKSRTQMFSGKKAGVTNGVVPSLYHSSMKILCDNIDAIEDTGGVPFLIMEPLLQRCTPEQLERLEEYNPYFTEDTGDIWKRHCNREFRGQQPDDMESWKELFYRMREEREHRLHKINQKITAAQAAKLPVRQAKLAYVSTTPKAPVNVRRRQEKNGTKPLVVPRRPPTKVTSQTSIRNLAPSLSDLPTQPIRKPAPNPMMKAARRMFKAQRGRVNSSVMRR